MKTRWEEKEIQPTLKIIEDITGLETQSWLNYQKWMKQHLIFLRKRRQMSSNGSPFASPINIPTNISGGALGIWAGFSPYHDTLYCIE